MKFKRWITVLVMMVLLLQGLSGTAMAVTVREVAGEFICNCGCNKGLAHCDMECGQSMRAFIKTKIDSGLGKAQIVAYLKENYGKEALAAPEKKGFDLIAWIMPFAVVFAGGIGVVKIMSSWIDRNDNDDDGDRDDNDSGDVRGDTKEAGMHDERIENELKDFVW